MNELLLNDEGLAEDLFPFTLTRHVADLRVGILTIREKWERLTGQPVVLVNGVHSSKEVVFPANVIPFREFIPELMTSSALNNSRNPAEKLLQYPWDIFQHNDWAIREDFTLITDNRQSQKIPPGVQTLEPANIFIEEGATLTDCTLNASTGPIYIGRNALIMEGALIRGPFALCEGAVVKMGAKIYGATTIGPYSTAGGEIKNSVVLGYSNKAHDGYLGDSVIGEWCNLGAGTTTSNLKNNAGVIKVWHQGSHTLKEAGMKCGLLMGDYSRCAINTSFNSGTVVGVSANVFGEGLTPSYIPDFAWGYKPLVKYEFDKALRDISNWKKLKGKILSEQEINQLRNIFNQL